MKETTNLKLKKYDYSDTVDMSTGHNLNMDIIDTEIQTLKTGKANATHTHTKANITDFAHTHQQSDIVGLNLTATNVNITDTNNYFTATNVEGALNELFQSADNGKNTIATSVGSPLLSTDTFSAMGTKIDTLTNTFKTNLTSKGVTVGAGDKMSSLIDKVGSIEVTDYPLPKWYNGSGFWMRCQDSPFNLYQQPSVVNNKIYVFDNSYVHIYDTETNLWNSKTTPYTTLDSSAISNIGNFIYAMGGTTTPNSNKCYDTVSNTWSTKTDLITARYSSMRSYSVGTNIYIFGGYDSSNSIYSVIKKLECYDTVSNTWSTKTDFSNGVVSFSMVGNDSCIYCIGGHDSTNNTTNKTRKYDILSNTWSLETNALSNIASHTSSIVGNLIYCIGGTQDSTNNSSVVTIYNIVSKTWERGLNGIATKGEPRSCVINNHIYYIGGRTKYVEVLVIKK